MPMNSAAGFACVAIGGALGASLRYAVTLMLSGMDTRFPYATVIANLSGAFMAGLIVTVLVSRGMLGSSLHLLSVVGFLGSFTTLSAFSIDTMRLMQAGDWIQASVNMILTFAGCLIAVYLGSALARVLA